MAFPNELLQQFGQPPTAAIEPEVEELRFIVEKRGARFFIVDTLEGVDVGRATDERRAQALADRLNFEAEQEGIPQPQPEAGLEQGLPIRGVPGGGFIPGGGAPIR